MPGAGNRKIIWQPMKNRNQKDENYSDQKNTVQLKINELIRNYDVGLDLIEKTTNKQDFLETFLDQYIERLNEMPGADIQKICEQRKIDEKKEKLKSLIMFATQAVVLLEKAELYKRLEEKNDELKTKNKQLDLKNNHYLNMISFVSHELRNPLISILGFAELLNDRILGEINEDQYDAIKVIVRVTKDLLSMINNYLDLSKIETGQLQVNLKKEPVNIIQDVIKPVMSELENQSVKKDMEILILHNSNIPVVVDKELMKIVFKNLFSNAIKYGYSGSSITCSILSEDNKYLFSVKNLGKGVRAKQLSSIFNKFYQLHDIYQPEMNRGTGLGLFIVKTIIEEHNGKVWAESSYNEWFQVNFNIPQRIKKAANINNEERCVSLENSEIIDISCN